jgi:hypothetical protein
MRLLFATFAGYLRTFRKLPHCAKNLLHHHQEKRDKRIPRISSKSSFRISKIPAKMKRIVYLCVLYLEQVSSKQIHI